jgi:hypothetical protein
MKTQEIIDSISDYRKLLVQNAEAALHVERVLSNNPNTAAKVGRSFNKCRERQRDYAAIIRTLDLMHMRFTQGKPWQEIRMRVEQMGLQLTKKYAKMEAIICGLKDSARPVG